MASLSRPFASLSLRASSSRLLPSIAVSASQKRLNSTATPSDRDNGQASASSSSSPSDSSASASPSSVTRAPTSSPSQSSSNASSSSTPSSSSSSSAFLASLSPSSLLPYHPVPRSPYFPSAFPSPPQHKYLNFPEPLFKPPPVDEFPDRVGLKAEQRREEVSQAITGLKRDEMRALRRYTVVMKRVVKMTKKGKMPSFMTMMVIGSPERGLVGIGRGRGSTTILALDSAYHKAVQSMDYVNKYENRTIWSTGQDMKYKWGSTTVILRARPAGFGLMVPPVIHRVLTCAGIKDCSATIEGSRNPMQVLKATIQLLHPGGNPPGFGSGVGTKGRREDKGLGMRSKDEIEVERGRYGIDVGRRV